MSATVVVGGQFGDEGKGKIISYLALDSSVVATVRGGVGPNAGHTVRHGKKTYRLRMLPSAVANSRIKLMIGPGVLVDPKVLISEMSRYRVNDRVVVDQHCAIIEQIHLQRDKKLKRRIGSTGTGTGPANADRALRVVKLAKDVPSLSPYVADVSTKINELLDEGKNILIEGTQGTFLSVYHGTYPYVTSKDVTASAICSDVGLGPLRVNEVLLVLKAYVTRVGAGPLEGELDENEIERRGWNEVGTVTGRPRRAAPMNLAMAKRAVILNSASQIAITKLDVLFPELRGSRREQDLSKSALKFIDEVEQAISVPVSIIGTGPGILDVIDRRVVSSKRRTVR
tara:strand:- start:3339 stop:4361 length:1023 start_codon:yes stop_codon:yes gene_type:complete